MLLQCFFFLSSWSDEETSPWSASKVIYFVSDFAVRWRFVFANEFQSCLVCDTKGLF